MKTNTPRRSHLHRAVSKKQLTVTTACAARLLRLLLLTLPAVVQAQFDYTTINGTITITGYTGPSGAVAIPATINGLPVTGIGNFAFAGKTSLTSVTIPNSVTSIGNRAFSSCTSLTSVAIPNSVTSIGPTAFEHCTSLTSVMIGNGVTSIGDAAFLYCTSLSAITVEALNAVYSSVDGVLFNKSQSLLINCPGGKAGSYTIPDSVTSIGGYAFYYCPSLTSVTIPTSVTTMGDGAFFYCTSLTSVAIPNSVTSIGNSAFSYCTNMTTVAIPKSVTNIGHDAFFDCTSLGSVTIGSSVTSIGDYAFAGCTSLTSVTIPNSVTSIGERAFSYCTNLTGVFFQGNVPDVGLDVFEGANNVTVCYLPGTTGWGTTFAGRPAVLWNPLVATSDASFGVRTNRFGFTITGASDLVIVVEAATNLADPTWVPVGTNTLTGGSSYFSDPDWTNHPARFYRLRSP